MAAFLIGALSLLIGVLAGGATSHFGWYLVSLIVFSMAYWFSPIHLVIALPSYLAIAAVAGIGVLLNKILAVPLLKKVLAVPYFIVVHLLGTTWYALVWASGVALITFYFAEPWSPTIYRWLYLAIGGIASLSLVAPTGETSVWGMIESLGIYLSWVALEFLRMDAILSNMVYFLLTAEHWLPIVGFWIGVLLVCQWLLTLLWSRVVTPILTVSKRNIVQNRKAPLGPIENDTPQNSEKESVKPGISLAAQQVAKARQIGYDPVPQVEAAEQSQLLGFSETPGRKTPAKFRTIVAFSLAILFALFVWPTRYRYDHLVRPAYRVGRITSGGSSDLIRIDRFSSRVDILRSNGWQCYSSCPSPAVTILDPSQLLKLELKVNLDPNGYLHGNLYNGSDWAIEEITYNISITAKDSSNILMSRKLRKAFYVDPLQVRDFDDYTKIVWDSNTMGFWSITITDAKGVRF